MTTADMIRIARLALVLIAVLLESVPHRAFAGPHGSWFLNIRENGLWNSDGPGPGLTSARLGYRRSGPSLDWSLQAGPRFLGADRADWVGSIEAAWRPSPSLELYGEWEPLLLTGGGQRGLAQEARVGTVVSLGKGPVRFDAVQDVATAVRGLYLKAEHRGAWGVGGQQQLMSASPRLGWSLEQDAVSLSVEAGPGFVIADEEALRTDLFGEMDLTIRLNPTWKLYAEYRPSVGFVAGEQGWVHRLKGGLVMAF